MELRETQLSQRRILIFWIPLAAMWLFMSVEQPGINAVIARLADAKINLAAYGISISLALIIESPIIQMLTAATALSDSRHNYRKLLTFMNGMAVILTAVHFILGFTHLYTLLLRDVMDIPAAIIGPAKSSFMIMLPWSATIGYRRLYQGILIRHGKTREITYTMFIRLCITMGTLAVAARWTNLQGADLGAFSLIMGVTGGMMAAYFFARSSIRDLPEEGREKKIGWRYLVTFYYPLLLTSVITFIARPVLNYGIARAADPIESLAVWPVVLSVMFLFRALAISYQEVVVALLKEAGDIAGLKTFAVRMAAVIGGVFLIFALSPAGGLWFRYVAGLEEELLGFTAIPTIIIAVVPVMGAFLSYYRGVLVYANRTKYIAQAVFLNTAALTVMVALLPRLLPIPGVLIAAIAFSVCQFIEVFYLWYRASRAVSDA